MAGCTCLFTLAQSVSGTGYCCDCKHTSVHSYFHKTAAGSDLSKAMKASYTLCQKGKEAVMTVLFDVAKSQKGKYMSFDSTLA